MSARDELVRLVATSDDCGCEIDDFTQSWAELEVDKYAHELAEQLRALLGPPAPGDGWWEGITFAANEIDPEVP